ncbi:MAG: GMC family oxidoreductase N-terminal domain-containing protein [Silvibacterium sp.]|nr:GMC family oxidoreductase N-terminal domain-containing protein [Silvibacterium sp.]
MAGKDFDYIVIGSGAGGGPLAANLAKAGFRVMLLEAGADSCSEGDEGRYMYEVPIFHGHSTEYKECAWNFFVRHYSDDNQQKRDSKFFTEQNGVWYPRAGTLGGCTAHNAMITVLPQDSDWNDIAKITNDDSWNAEKMNGYFERLEKCTYVPRPGSLSYDAGAGFSAITEFLKGHGDWKDLHHGHGFDGWLTTSEADPRLAIKDKEIVVLLLNGIKSALEGEIGNPILRLITNFDPNDYRNRRYSPEGLAFTPLAVDQGKRNGPREYLLRIKKEYPNNLVIHMRALATRVLFEGFQAIGVEFVEGPSLYSASPNATPGQPLPARQQVTAKEVIVAGGAFNSPQLLMLSGVGPAEQLAALGIPVVVDLPGVGSNLQDRYEVGVVSEWKKPFSLLSGATFAPPQPGAAPDEFLEMWKAGGGVYASNGALIGIIKKSNRDKPDPDLYIFGLPGFFKGYFPGYSTQFERFHNRFTWAILKAHTNNTAGRVSLRSNDPRDTPQIEFHYFKEGNDTTGADLEAVIQGVEFVRKMNSTLSELIGEEMVPGTDVKTRDDLSKFIQNEAWGHHASCTNKIGADDDPMAVLDSRFRVRGTQGLRVVDASVFPRIPGYFIVSAVYIVSEKASDVIIEDARQR